jgi:magnesium chelatase family protein
VGELSLDGRLRGVRGTLPIAIEARRTKVKWLAVPEVNAREAAMVGDVEVYRAKSLVEVIHLINAGNGLFRLQVDTGQLLNQAQQFHVDFKDVRGSRPRSGRSKWRVPAGISQSWCGGYSLIFAYVRTASP